MINNFSAVFNNGGQATHFERPAYTLSDVPQVILNRGTRCCLQIKQVTWSTPSLLSKSTHTTQSFICLNQFLIQQLIYLKVTMTRPNKSANVTKW